MWIKALIGLAGLICIGPATAETPLSAIDWLSESVKGPASSVSPLTDFAPRPIQTEDISVTTLSNNHASAIGLISANIAGIPVDFWSGSDVGTLANLLRLQRQQTLPEVQSLLRRITLAELDQPDVSIQSNPLLLARLDRLLGAGALDEAEALIDKTGVSTVGIFRRWFDVSLLSQRSEAACAEMIANPKFSLTLTARVFCLARSGDWTAASLTLSTGKLLGQIDPKDVEILELFLDTEKDGLDALDNNPARLTPLQFVIREAIGLNRPGRPLPLAFIQTDLQNKSGWRQRLVSGERLARSRAIPATTLRNIYLEGKPSASGGVWNRVMAIADLDTAIKSGNVDKISGAVTDAYPIFADVALEGQLADMYAEALAPFPLMDWAAKYRTYLCIFKEQSNAEACMPAAETATDSTLNPVWRNLNEPSTDDFETAIHNVWTNPTPGRHVEHQGETVLRALSVLSSGSAAGPRAVQAALQDLVRAGFEPEAKKIGQQLLIRYRGVL